MHALNNIQESRTRRALYIPACQQGFTLVMSLVFLLLLTIIGVTGMNMSSLQQKMAGNQRDQDMAFQAAESALRDGEAKLAALAASGKPVADATASNSIWSLGNTDVTNQTWWDTNSIEYGGSGKQITQADADPRYVLEESDFVDDSLNVPTTYSGKPGVQYYKVTSRSVGITGVSQSMLEDTYRIRFN